jgi:hypothetical protein
MAYFPRQRYDALSATDEQGHLEASHDQASQSIGGLRPNAQSSPRPASTSSDMLNEAASHPVSAPPTTFHSPDHEAAGVKNLDLDEPQKQLKPTTGWKTIALLVGFYVIGEIPLELLRTNR